MRDLFIALMFYTRIPTPEIKNFKTEETDRAIRCFSLVGWIIGAICFAVYFIGWKLFSSQIGIVLSLVAGVLATGCFHEDGFADMVDGFGGGIGKQRILEIMKDSRIGSYGTIATVLMYALKFFTLEAILSSEAVSQWWQMLLIFIIWHSLARLTAGNMVFFSRYCRDDGTSKIKPVEKGWGPKEVIGLWSFGVIPLGAAIWFCPWCALIPVALIVVFLLFKHYFEKRIDGYTGDCLGALEQISEAIILLSFVAILNFI